LAILFLHQWVRTAWGKNKLSPLPYPFLYCKNKNTSTLFLHFFFVLLLNSKSQFPIVHHQSQFPISNSQSNQTQRQTLLRFSLLLRSISGSFFTSFSNQIQRQTLHGFVTRFFNFNFFDVIVVEIILGFSWLCEIILGFTWLLK